MTSQIEQTSEWPAERVWEELDIKPLPEEEIFARKAAEIGSPIIRFIFKHPNTHTPLFGLAIVFILVGMISFSGIIFWGWFISTKAALLSLISFVAALFAAMAVFVIGGSTPFPEDWYILHTPDQNLNLMPDDVAKLYERAKGVSEKIPHVAHATIMGWKNLRFLTVLITGENEPFHLASWRAHPYA